MIFQMNGTPGDTPFPDPELAEKEPDGLLAIGGDLTPERLRQAYSQGIFPWFSGDQPILWWSPDPRTVLYPSKLHVSRSLRRQLRRDGLAFTIDTAFDQVTAACAAPRAGQDGTWLGEEMQGAYRTLHQLGIAHSIELWADRDLVGGLYGVGLGRAFFGESMFSRIPSASRIVMVFVCERLRAFGYPFLDCQVFNPHLATMGAEEIPRTRFLAEVTAAVEMPEDPRMWQLERLECTQLEHAKG